MALLFVLSLLAVAGGIFVAYHRDSERVWRRSSAGSRMAQTSRGPVEYATGGMGPPVLAIHGAGGGFDQGLELAHGLITRGFQVIAMSRFGYLRTPLPADASPAAQADAHAALLDALGIERVAVLGASAGAPSALQLALRHPERVSALVLLVPALWSPPADGGPGLHQPPGGELAADILLRSDFLFWGALRLMPATLMRAVTATPPEAVARASPVERTRVEQFVAHLAPISARRIGLLNEMKVIGSLQRDELERIAAPTLAISTEDDLYGTLAGARYTAAHIPGARLITWPTGGHLLAGHGEDAAAAIAEFLRAAKQGARQRGTA